MKVIRGAMCAALAALAMGCGSTQSEGNTEGSEAQSLRATSTPDGKGGGTLRQHSTSTASSPTGQASSANGIVYHGGPIMPGTVNVYFIWYGNWSGNTATTILPDWASNIGGSLYYNINNTYYTDSGLHVDNAIHYAGSTTDNYSRGTALADSDIQTIVFSALSSGRLPVDTNALYFVLTSSDVNETSGFCTSYCGWHTYATYNSSNIKYSFVGNPDRCPSACEAQTTSPNGNSGADGMVSVMTHELEETTSDSNLNAWYDSSGAENGDKCAWTFGAEYTVSNGSKANVHLGSRDYLIQQNWVNNGGGYCALSDSYTTLVFNAHDDRLTSSTGDWDVGFYKSECNASGVATGVSATPSSGQTHAALCRWDSASTYPHQSCHTVTFSSGDNRWTTTTGDWDAGYYKGECGSKEYVAGVSLSNGDQVNSILCCAGLVSHSSCSAHVFSSADSREASSSGEWDYGFYKGECGDGRYLAGLSRTTASSGAPHAVLCCSP